MKAEITKALTKLAATVSKNSPVILTGMAIVGVGATIYFTVKGTVKSVQDVEELKDERLDELNGLQKLAGVEPEVTKTEIAKTIWKNYIPTAICTAMTITCIISAHAISAKRLATLGALYALSEDKLKEFKEATVDTLGEKKADQIQKKIDEKLLAKDPPASVLAGVANGDVLCYDRYTDRYFHSNMEKIRQAVVAFKEYLFGDPFGGTNLNDFYQFISPELEACPSCEDIGWNVNHVPELSYTSRLRSDGMPCLMIDFKDGHGPSMEWLEV